MKHYDIVIKGKFTPILLTECLSIIVNRFGDIEYGLAVADKYSKWITLADYVGVGERESFVPHMKVDAQKLEDGRIEIVIEIKHQRVKEEK